MKTVMDSCTPRPEVLEGLLAEDVFAAELTPVLRGEGPQVYREAETFFANTYPTQGLRALVREVFLRLSGQGGNPLLRLETAMGGGKTHGLIALYHLARTGEAASEELLPPELRLREPVRIAAVVGKDFGPEGYQHGSLRVATLWGEIAWQLGGEEAYQAVALADRQGSAPGGDVWRAILGQGPVLIMLDELGVYMRSAQARKLAGRGTLADQVPAFLVSLAGAVASHPRASLVITLTGAEDAFAEEVDQTRRALDEVRDVQARQELVLRPTQDEEVPHVVVRRLFEKVDKEAAQETARVYANAYLAAEQKQAAELPPRAVRPEYQRRLQHTYPFHPEFIDLLMNKVSTLPRFQRTRGALRLLARVVRSVWRQRPEDAWLLHPFHFDFADEETRADLTHRLEKDDLAPVIHADIHCPEGTAHAQEQDRDWLARGKPPLASRLAKAIYLHSLPLGRAGRAPLPDLMLACLQPGLDPDLLREALQGLAGDEGCWFLHSDEDSFWFHTEATPNRVIHQQMEQITTLQAKELCRKRLGSIYNGGSFRLVPFPEGPHDVDDDGQGLKLCLMDFDLVTMRADSSVPPQVSHIQDRCGALEGFRQYKNALVYLLADPEQIDPMVDAARRLLALQHIVNSPDLMNTLSAANQRVVRDKLGSAQVELRVALTRAYRHLLFPDPDSTADPSGLRHVTLDVEEAARIESENKPGSGGQQKVLRDALTEAGKLMPPELAPDPQLIRKVAWPQGQQILTTRELSRLFKTRPRLPMLLNEHRLRETIRKGIEQEAWGYFDGKRVWTRYSEALSEADIRLDSEHELWLPQVVTQRGYCPRCGYSPCRCGPSQPPELCPRCGKPLPQCTCPRGLVVFQSSRTGPQKAFTEFTDWARDHQVPQVAWLEVQCYDRPADLQQVWIGMTSLCEPRHLTVTFEGAVELPVFAPPSEAAEARRDNVSVTYQGRGDNYRRVYEFFQGLAGSLQSGSGALTFAATFQAHLAQPLAPEAREIDDLRRRLVQSEVSQITLRAQPLPPAEQA